MTANSDFYEKFAERYCDYYRLVDAEEAVRQWCVLLHRAGIEPQDATKAAVKPSLLDLGCGPGWHLRAWQREGYEVSGLDASPAMLALAATQSNLQGHPRMQLYRGDILDNAAIARIGHRFDRIVSHFNFCNLFASRELEVLFDNVCTLLTPLGLFIFDYSTRPFEVAVDETSEVQTTQCADGLDFKVVRHWALPSGSVNETYWFHGMDQLRRLAQAHSFALLHEINWRLGKNSVEARKIIVLAKSPRET